MTQQYDVAMEWYRRAAEGLAEAEHNLGMMYVDGRGVARVGLGFDLLPQGG